MTRDNDADVRELLEEEMASTSGGFVVTTMRVGEEGPPPIIPECPLDLEIHRLVD
ncbi:hypothetical protein [Mesorhizobium sp.]|uniref:hypothetical protein n=1 Tax=Mesorhizobium sp. TaxID=1871066 RepID=UPI002587409A|nr:hypothetical protein [Mesorhizobium sp.]